MRATEIIEKKLGNGLVEWRVALDRHDELQWEDYKAMKSWLMDNCPGDYGHDFLMCTHSNYVSFRNRNEATLFYMAFA